MSLDTFSTYDFGNEKEQKSTLDIKKEEISQLAYQDLASMKGKIEFNIDQIKTLEKELGKRFRVSNVLNQIIEDSKVDKYEIQAFMVEFQNGTFDRYYTKNGEIKEITPKQEKEIKDFIGSLLEKILENGYSIYSNDDLAFLESFGYNLPEKVQKRTVLSLDSENKNSKTLIELGIGKDFPSANMPLNDDKINFKQLSNYERATHLIIPTALGFGVGNLPGLIAGFLGGVGSQYYTYSNKEEIKEEITNDLYQIDDSFKG